MVRSGSCAGSGAAGGAAAGQEGGEPHARAALSSPVSFLRRLCLALGPGKSQALTDTPSPHVHVSRRAAAEGQSNPGSLSSPHLMDVNIQELRGKFSLFGNFVAEIKKGP